MPGTLRVTVLSVMQKKEEVREISSQWEAGPGDNPSAGLVFTPLSEVGHSSEKGLKGWDSRATFQA